MSANPATSAEDLLRQILTQLQGTKGIDQLAASYVEAWAELDNVVKNASNPHFGSDYADLSAVLDTVKPVFARFGLAILGPVPGAVDDKGNLGFTTLLLHRSGQHLAFSGSIPIGKPTAQAAGSASTYFRRYTVSAIGGIAQKDDDGEVASSAAPQKPRARKAVEDESPRATAELIMEIEAFTGSPVELESALRKRVEEMADEQVNTAYINKRRTLKKGSK